METVTVVPTDWAALVAVCNHSGHVLCRCPVCGFKQFRSYRPKSQLWPTCFMCVIGDRLDDFGKPVRLEPHPDYERDAKGQIVVLCKNPGQPRTARQLKAEGFVARTKTRSKRPSGSKVVADPTT